MDNASFLKSKLILGKLNELAYHAGAPSSVVEEAINKQLSSGDKVASMEEVIDYILQHGDAKVALERAQAAEGILKA